MKIANSHLDAQELREKFFSCEGRLNRKPFIMRLFGVIIVSTVVALLLYSLFFKGFGSQTAAEAVTTIVSIIEGSPPVTPLVVLGCCSEWVMSITTGYPSACIVGMLRISTIRSW